MTEDESLTVSGAKIYKLFSNVDVSSLLSQIFIDVSDSHVQVSVFRSQQLKSIYFGISPPFGFLCQAWPYTFPELIPTINFQPIILAQNLYYLNTMESVASAMEASVISGRNTAQLIISSNF